MKFLFSILFIIAFSISNCHSQGKCFLSIEHNDISKRNFYPGSEINFYIDNMWYRGVIDSLNDTFIYMGGGQIAIKQIKAIKLFHKKFNYEASGGSLILGGFLIAGVDGANYIISKEQRNFSKNSIIISCSAFVLGTLLLCFNSRVYKLGDKNKLVTICL